MGCIVVMYKHLLFSPLFHIINRRHYFRDRGLKLNIANIYDGDTIYCKLPFTNQIHISNHLFGHLICTLISENQGLEKSRSVSNLRKISGPANLHFFHCFITISAEIVRIQNFKCDFKKILATLWWTSVHHASKRDKTTRDISINHIKMHSTRRRDKLLDLIFKKISCI